MNINLKNINKGINFIVNLIWLAVIILYFYELLNSKSIIDALSNIGMIAVALLIMYYSSTVDNLRKQNVELSEKIKEQDLQISIKDLLNNSLDAVNKAGDLVQKSSDRLIEDLKKQVENK